MTIFAGNILLTGAVNAINFIIRFISCSNWNDLDANSLKNCPVYEDGFQKKKKKTDGQLGDLTVL